MRDWLLNFKPTEEGKVLMGDDQSCNITGTGSIRFKMWDETFRTLENVRLVPELRRNLISLGMLDLNRGSYKSENGILEVMKGSIVVLQGILKQGLYILQGEAISGHAAVSSSEINEPKVWHIRILLRWIIDICAFTHYYLE